LVSRNGNTVKRFATLAIDIAAALPIHAAILDGALVCVGSDARRGSWICSFEGRRPSTTRSNRRAWRG